MYPAAGRHAGRPAAMNGDTHQESEPPRVRGINSGTHFLFCGGRLVVGALQGLLACAMAPWVNPLLLPAAVVATLHLDANSRACAAATKIAIHCHAGPDWRSLLGSTVLIIAPTGRSMQAVPCCLLCVHS